MVEQERARIATTLLMPTDGERHFTTQDFARIRVRPWRKEFFLRWVRPIAAPVLGERRHDLWHMTHQMSRYEPLDPRVPVLLTIHDLTFLHEAPREGRSREIARKCADTQRRIDRAAAIAVDSRFVADDLRRELDVTEKPIHVIPLGLEAVPRASSAPPVFLADSAPFLLSVGNALAHKNFHTLLGLVDRLPGRRLVIAGNMQTPYGNHLQREVSRRGLEGRVVLPGEVGDADRQWLYENCEAFLFPSLSEGFGLPVLEAMHAGRPIFVSRLTSLPEVVGEHGCYFDSFAPEAMAAEVTRGIASFAADPARAAASRAHALSFSWRETVRRYADLYVQVAEAAAPMRS
jgi:glycosyltransferase involved in cell wall biosynthesis